MKRNIIVLMGSVLITLAGFMAVQALSVGQVVSNVTIKDSSNNPASLPDFGTKVLTIVYADSTAADFSDPISDALKAKKFPESKNRGFGIANCYDSKWVADSIIRTLSRNKEKKYNTKVLTDLDLTFAKAWGLGNCDDKSVFIIVGKDKVVKYIKKFSKNSKPTQSDIDEAVKIVDALVNGK